MSLPSARLGVRLARREVRHHPWRSALVLLMVLVPTMAMTVAATALRTAEWSGNGRRLAEYGQANYVAKPDPRPEAVEDTGRLAARLPAGTFLLARSTGDRVRTEDAAAFLTISDLPVDDPIVDGRFGHLNGRAPEAEDEAVVSTTLADELDLQLGDEIRPSRFDDPVRVVGTVVRMLDDDDVLYVTPSKFEAELADEVGDPNYVGQGQSAVFYIHHVGGASPLPVVTGWPIVAVPDLLAFNHDSDLFWVYVGGAVGLFLVGTIITAAFAVGARRQLRTIGLLSSTGASPRTVRWFLVTQGLVGGALGSVLGVLAALGAVRLVPDHVLSDVYNRPIAGPVTHWSDVLPIVLLGTFAGAVAAWFPARSASRVSTLQALAGRRPVGHVPTAIPVLGMLAIVGGSLLLAYATVGGNSTNSDSIVLIGILGSVTVLSGTLAIAPWAVAGLEPITGRVGHAVRLAGRSLTRSRVRSSAVVGALCAVIATLVVGGTIYRSVGADRYENDFPYLGPDHALIEDGGSPVQDHVEAVADVLHADRTVALRNVIDDSAPHGERVVRAEVEVAGDSPAAVRSGVYAVSDTGPSDVDPDADVRAAFDLGIAEPELLDALRVPDDLRQALDDGKAILVTEVDARSDEVLLVSGYSSSSDDPGSVPLGGSFDSPQASYALPQVLIGPGVAEDLGLHEGENARTLIDAGHRITDAERHQIGLLNDDWSYTSQEPGDYSYVNLPDDPPPVTPLEVRLGIYAFVMLSVGLVVAIGLGLAAKDSQDESRVLDAVGATPRTLRRVSALRAALLVVTATVVALPTGLLCSWVVVRAIQAKENNYYGPHERFPFRLDVPTIVFLLLAPLVVAALALGWARIRDLIRPTRPDTFAFAD